MSLITHAAGDVTVMSDRPGRSMSGYALLVGGFVLLIVAVYLGWTSLGRSSGGGLLAILMFLSRRVCLEGAVHFAAERQGCVAAPRQLHRVGA